MMSALPVVSALLLLAVRASALQAPQSSGFLAAESSEYHRYPLTLLQRATALVEQRDASGTFGPDNCVEVSKSKNGTCVLETKCKSADELKDVDFGFVCVSDKGNLLHSYGPGNFKKAETFDSGVECTECLPPPSGKSPVDGNGTIPEYEPMRSDYLKQLLQKHPPAEASFFGPRHCVLTYRSPDGTCIMETRCQNTTKEEMRTYDFGLTCVDSQGKSERHLFGTNSFSQEERFDTLIQCDLCLGLDATQDHRSQLVNTIGDLKSEVKALHADVETVKASVKKLQDATADDKAAEPAKAEKAPAEEAAKSGIQAVEKTGDDEAQEDDSKATQEVHKKKHHRAAHKRHHKKKHHKKKHRHHHKKKHHHHKKKHHTEDEDEAADEDTEEGTEQEDDEKVPAVVPVEKVSAESMDEAPADEHAADEEEADDAEPASAEVDNEW